MNETSLAERMKFLEFAPPVEPTPHHHLGDRDVLLGRAIEMGRDHPVCSLSDSELKGFLVWLEATNPTQKTMSALLRQLLNHAIPALYPNEWDAYQTYVRGHNVVYRHRTVRKI